MRTLPTEVSEQIAPITKKQINELRKAESVYFCRTPKVSYLSANRVRDQKTHEWKHETKVEAPQYDGILRPQLFHLGSTGKVA